MRYNRLFIILICLISYTAITAQTVTVADTLKARKGLVVAGKTITSITETVNGSSTTKQVPTALSVWNALSGYLSAGTSFSGDVSGVYSNLQIGANAVGSTEIAANAVSEAKIGTGQVTTTKIADGAVTTAKIADANVTMAKIAQSGASTGQAIVWSGTAWGPGTVSGGGGTPAGSNGQIQFNSSGTFGASSNLFWNNSSTFLGVNNGTPLASVHAVATGTANIFLAEKNSENISAPVSAFRKTRGTPSAKTAVLNGDLLGSFDFQGMKADNFSFSSDHAFFGGMVTGVPSGVNIPTSIFFKTGSAAAPYNSTMYLHHTGKTRFGANTVLSTLPEPWAKTDIIGTGNTSSTYGLIVTNANATSATATIAVRDDGNVGIGRNDPSYKLDILGGLRLGTSTVQFGFGESGGNSIFMGSLTNHPFKFVVNTNEVARMTAAGLGLFTDSPTAKFDLNGTARFRNFTTAGNVFTHDASGNLTDITPASLISSGGGITGTAVANAVPYWNAGATTLTTGGMTKDATNLNLENGLGLKLISSSAANMILNATATEGTIQTYGSVPLKLNPLGNGIYIGGLTGGTGKALSLSEAGLVGVIDVGSGTVTTTSITTANGFSGTVANPTTTPAITLSTTITGILKGNGTAISSATAGTDYVTPSMSANQVVTTGNYAFTIDASTASSTISNPLTIKGKADGTNSTQSITFANAAGTAQSTVTVSNVATYLTAVAGKNLILGVGTTPFWFKENGSLLYQNLSVNPSASGNRGGLFYNSALDRFAYSDGTNNHYIAKLSDIAGSNATYTSSQTVQAYTSTIEADANTGNIVLTVDGTMTADFSTLVRATRNNTNSVTITAGSGYVLKIDGDAAVTGSSYPLTAGEIVTIRRDGTKIFVNK